MLLLFLDRIAEAMAQRGKVGKTEQIIRRMSTAKSQSTRVAQRRRD